MEECKICDLAVHEMNCYCGEEIGTCQTCGMKVCNTIKCDTCYFECELCHDLTCDHCASIEGVELGYCPKCLQL